MLLAWTAITYDVSGFPEPSMTWGNAFHAFSLPIGERAKAPSKSRQWKRKATSTSGILSKCNSKPTSVAQAGWHVRLAARATIYTRCSASLHWMANCYSPSPWPWISISSNTIRQLFTKEWRRGWGRQNNDYFLSLTNRTLLAMLFGITASWSKKELQK